MKKLYKYVMFIIFILSILFFTSCNMNDSGAKKMADTNTASINSNFNTNTSISNNMLINNNLLTNNYQEYYI